MKKTFLSASRNGLNSAGEFQKSIASPCLFNRKEKNVFKNYMHKIFDGLPERYVILPGYDVTLIKIHSWGNNIVSDLLPKHRFKKAIFGGCDALKDSMAILADGSYSLCCADYDGKVVIGNAHKQSLKSCLASNRAQKIRRGFFRGKLPFEYCKLCRGGYSYSSCFFNQFHSYLFYNFGLYHRLRSLF